MKKLMKAIAFATVMCMLLSTAAFAANQDITIVDEATQTITVNVKGASAGEQVALLIVPASIEDFSFNPDEVIHIDQLEAGEDGAVFANIVVNENVDTIDVYAGYASNTAPVAEKVAEDLPLKSVRAITVEIGEGGKIFESDIMSLAQDAVGAAVAMEVSFENVTDNLALTKVIFALETAEFGRRYTKAIDVAEEGWEILEGSVKISAGINNGMGGEKIATIEDFDAIFLFEDDANDLNNQEVFTNPETDNVDEKRAN